MISTHAARFPLEVGATAGSSAERHPSCAPPGLNRSRIVPKGPEQDLSAPHDRQRLGPRTV